MKQISNTDDLLPILKSRQNMLITGSAGSGKSFFASQYQKTVPYTVLTATTGVAALTLGGETAHRFLGLGTTARPEEAGKILGRWDKIRKSQQPWDVAKWGLMKKLRTLIIDEASMLRRDQFELIDVVLAHVKDNSTPFGGVQMVLVGDMFQLPPVVSSSDTFLYPDLREPFCFQSALWSQAGFQSFNLTTNHRQGEGVFLSALEKIRAGQVTDDIAALLDGRVNATLNTTLQPVKLFAHKVDVSKENLECLKRLPGDKYLSDAEFEGKKYDTDILAKECPAECKLYFCKDAQVMMLTNDFDGRWANGTLGTVESCQPLKVRLSNGLVVEVGLSEWERNVPYLDKLTGDIKRQKVGAMKQYPIKLAWSSSIHKSQSTTLEYVEADLSKCFAAGMSYTALSRVKTLEGLRLTGWNRKAIFADERVKVFYGI